MFTVLITGGIGSGKSAVCSYLSGKGVPVYDSDSGARHLYDSDPALVRSLEAVTGCTLVMDDGTFDRGKLAGIIFSDPLKLSECENIVHPAVLADFKRWRISASERLNGCGFVCIESAIAFGLPMFRDECDCSILVDAPIGVRIDRACRRDGVGRADVMKRVMSQKIPGRDAVDFVIENDGSMADLKKRVDDVFRAVVDKVKNDCGKSRTNE